jgi:hypothetical protein
MAIDLASNQNAIVADVSKSAVSWPAIFAGAVIAIAVSLILLTLGSGFGAAAASPWPGVGPTATTFTIAAGLWLIITQWISAGVGGYLTGRLRVRWVGTHTHEVFFRDTAHGFLAWAVATVAIAALAALAASATAGAGVHAAAAVVSGSGAADTADMARQAADVARKAAAAFSIFTGLSMLVGAFIACIAAALGGQQRDEHL